MTDKPSHSEILALTVDIVSAHVSSNRVNGENLARLLADVYRGLANVCDVTATPDNPVPALPIRHSVTPDYIVCLEDGRKLKMLKRHLQTAYGMTPEQYRERWNLPADYPMVAPNYAARRSELAKRIGLGRHGRGRG
jgi:predicted transcriptional regulator